MFSVVLQAYFSTRSSRSLEAGTCTPLSPESIQHPSLPRVHCEWEVASGWRCSF